MMIPSQLVAQVNRTSKSLIYLAAPLSTYNSATYEIAMSRLQRRFPSARLLLSRDLFTSIAHFRATYRAVLATVTLPVILTDPAGWLGGGVYTETSYLAHHHVPSIAILPNGVIWTPAILEIGNPTDWRTMPI